MTIKLLDIDYLRAQHTTEGQVVVISSTQGLMAAQNIKIIGGSIGIGTNNPTQPLMVVGNISVVGQGAGYMFSDGTKQNTASVTPIPGGSDGSIQYKVGSTFAGGDDLFWDAATKRLGIGTDQPRSTLQIKDVGYESTDTSTNNSLLIVLDSFPVPDYRSCHYIVQVTDTNYSWFHTSQIMLLHDGMAAFKSEYNIITSADRLGEFDCRINGGNVELTFTAAYDSEKNIKVIRTSIEP